MSRASSIVALACLCFAGPGLGAAPTAADLEFFETRIRPVLATECYECHDAKKQKGELRLDYRDALLKGGESGPTLIPGDAKRSLLIQSLTHEHPEIQMPKKRPKLDAKVIADFVAWVNQGAADPREQAPKESIPTAWADVLTVRKAWWSFQPIRPSEAPAGKAHDPIDRFLDQRIAQAGLQPAPKADKATLIRRATYTLTGLPPTPSEIAAFEADRSPDAYAKVVDRLLASPRYGEHFARHWMDLVRFAESHGSEGDAAIPQAWRYRDYLIRAFNDDVPYDQFVREQLAGDLLKRPRINTRDGLNESALGTGHFRMVEHGYQPVDTLDEQVRNVDNQIDVVSKTFLGLTVSCARCHEHKFDPISQADFYALYGVFASARPGQVTVDAPAVLDLHRERLTELKRAIRAELSATWIKQAEALPEAIHQMREVRGPERTRLRTRRAQLEAEINEAAFRLHLKAAGSQTGPAPTHLWTFEADGRDLVGKLDAHLQGGATIKDGRLVLDGKSGFAETGKTSETLTTKTMEAWVTLPTLEQRGGGAISIESLGGKVFDSLVFAEKQPRRWMAGSDNGVRSRDVGGPAEQAAPSETIHVVATYAEDGRISLYRNGQPYGSAYVVANNDGPHAFTQEQTHLLFGKRHTGGGNAFLQAGIEEARLYPVALTAEQVAASFKAGPVKTTDLGGADETLRLKRDELARVDARLAEIAQADGKFAIGRMDEQDPTNPLHAYIFTRVGLHPNPSKPVAAEAADWDLTKADAPNWTRHGNGFDARTTPGDFRVETNGSVVLRQILPSGLHSHKLSTKHSAVLLSPRFLITSSFVSVQAMGRGATLRLIPDNYPLSPGGTRFPKATINDDRPVWITLDSDYRKGSYAYLELTLPDDSTNPDGRPGELGWYGVRQVVFHDSKDRFPKGEVATAAPPVLPRLNEVVAALTGAARAWGQDQADETQAALLDNALRHHVLEAELDLSPALARLVAEYRRMEAEIAAPRRAPGLWEAPGFDQPLYVRGDHRKPAEAIPRRFLEAFGSQPFGVAGSGRLELAERIVSADNPLTARVMVNRLWHHVFGRGLVGTADNFGRLGDRPTHPELLDHLAQRFTTGGWSTKSLVRALLLTEAFQRSSTPTADAATRDGPNDLLSHMRVRRLEGEALRDTFLSLAGQLDTGMYGPGANALAAPKDQVRRSVYLTIRRNSLNPFITTFDGPKPFTTVGRRDSTNVPVQSLTLLNDPFTVETARRWAAQLNPKAPDDANIEALFRQGLGRPASAKELAAALTYLSDLRSRPGAQPWPDLAQAILNLKEFLYVK
jgi:hypothetical protein